MSADDILKLQKLIETLREQADFCLKRIDELEKELSNATSAPSPLNQIPDPVKRKKVAKLLDGIGYESGDSLRIAIKKLEDYIIKNEYINFNNLMVVPNKTIATAFDIKDGVEISYEKLIGMIPMLFKATNSQKKA